MHHTAIIGGGITGLATAFYLEKQGMEDIVLLEAGQHLGGKAKTLREGGFVVEQGPDSFVITKPHLMQLAGELGLKEQIVEPRFQKYFIYSGGQLREVPAGLSSFVPNDWKQFFGSDILSWKAKLRLLAEPIITPFGGSGDESLASFVKRRFGKEMLEQLAEPLFGGIHAAPSEELSLLATFPQFRQMEQKHGSITKAILAQRAKQPKGGGVIFRSFKNGMETVAEALQKNLTKTDVRLQTQVHKIIRIPGGYEVDLGEKTIQVQHLVITVPAPAAANIMAGFDEELVEALEKIEYSRSAILTLAYDAGAVPKPLDSTGFLIPRKEQKLLSACTFASQKWPNRAPEGKLLVRCFLKEVPAGEATEELVKKVHKELAGILALQKEPEQHWYNEWKVALPIYRVGHADLIGKIQERVLSSPDLYLAGASYLGSGLADCVRQAQETAQKIIGNG